MARLSKLVAGLLLLASSLVSSTPIQEQTRTLSRRQSTEKLVFCHFMIGIVSDRTSAADYDADMQRAKALGIDAFALNIGTDSFTDQQLGYAYESAANNGMSVFISFDFNWWATSSGSAVGAKIAQYAGLAAQLHVGDSVFASSFAGDGVDVSAIRAAAGTDVFFAPNFHPGEGDFTAVDAALNWMAWPNNGDNKAPTPGANVTVLDGDDTYLSSLAGKPYIAPVSAWFSTHYGPEVSYSKNWVFPSDLLWYERWNEVLTLGSQYLEIITWNDYGESHYIGPLDSAHYDDGNSKWTNDMPHDGWLDMAKPFIAAFKAGATSAASYIESDELVYWYRPTLKALDCDSTDTTMVAADNSSGNYFEGRPNGWEDVADQVFVVALLTEAGEVTVVSGSNVQTFSAPAGATAFAVDMEVGQQEFFLSRNNAVVMSAVSLRDVSSVCPCGLYNFNAFVGTVPQGFSDPLQADGLSSLTVGLHVTTCLATPSLGTATVSPTSIPTGAGTTVVVTTSPTTTAIATTTKATTSSTTTTSSASSSTSGVCIAGTGEGNYLGLCDFCCHYGYCPPGPCTCTAYGEQVTPPPATGTPGVPIAGEDDSYDGLCSYACDHGYCPDTACQY
ncbi:putative alpha-1,3-glucanase/mutanase [Xylariales sp. PMI_506]|nr:putative alpha-1,3-glucanase/mutanase [Xylariales sp. PMI_506]